MIIKFTLTVLLLSLCGSAVTLADQVILNNGRIMECTILSEHKDYVEISLGTGSMNLSRSQIRKLVRTGGTSDSPKTVSPPEGNVLSKQHAPKAYADLATRFRFLMTKRNEAEDAKYMANHYEREINTLKRTAEQLGAEVTSLNKALAAKSTEISSIPIPENPRTTYEVRRYNKLVGERNRLQLEADDIFAEIGPKEIERQNIWKKIPTLEEKQKQLGAPIGIYLNELKRFSAEYPEITALRSESENAKTQAFFEKIDRFLKQFQKEIRVVEIPGTVKGRYTHVQAVINGNTIGEFVFDTGATIMTISESFARRLGMDVENLPTSYAIVADGRKVEAKTTVLSSVAVGEALIRNVDIMVMPDSSNTITDGLLGMSFLKHFSVSMNGSTGEIKLSSFNAQ